MNKKTELVCYLAVTFSITYIIQYIGLLKGGILSDGVQAGMTPELQTALGFVMLIPALVAITMNRFITRRDTYKGKAVWFTNYYLLIAAEFLIAFVAVTVLQLHNTYSNTLMVFGAVTSITSILGTILLLALNSKTKWREDLEHAKLQIGGIKPYLLYGVLLVAFMTLGTYLDLFAGLGVGLGIEFNTLVLGVVNSLVLGPILGITTGVFGEEYGWRVYLQDLLTELYGKPIGILLVGVIWGLWHAPVVFYGWTYPGYGVLGIIVFIVFTTIAGFYLSHATFISGNVWVPAYLHAVINGYSNFTLNLVMMNDSVLNFRFGIYGLAILGVITLGLILRNRKIWEAS